MIRVVIAEDQQMLRGALTSLLELEDDIEVVAETSDGKEALQAIEKLKPDVSLLDIEMPTYTGLEVVGKMKELYLPGKVIIVTTFARPGYLEKAMKLGVDGYLLKDEPIDFLVSAIRKVKLGENVVSSDLAGMLFSKKKNPLTEREQEVLRLVESGDSTRSIAGRLFLTNGTVRNYLSSAIQKMGVESRHEAIKKAKGNGWLQ